MTSYRCLARNPRNYREADAKVLGCLRHWRWGWGEGVEAMGELASGELWL